MVCNPPQRGGRWIAAGFNLRNRKDKRQHQPVGRRVDRFDVRPRQGRNYFGGHSWSVGFTYGYPAYCPSGNVERYATHRTATHCDPLQAIPNDLQPTAKRVARTARHGEFAVSLSSKLPWRTWTLPPAPILDKCRRLAAASGRRCLLRYPKMTRSRQT